MKLSRGLFPVFIGILAAGIPLSVWAQPPEARNSVTVTGSGEIRVAPDMALVTVEAAFTRPTLREALAETRKAMDGVLAACGKVIPDSGDLRTTRLAANPEYDWTNGGRVFKGYSASQSLEITVRDLSKLEPLTEGIFKTSATGIGGLEFRHSKADSLRREAGALAVIDARENARKLCAAAQRSCDDLVSLRMAASGGGPMVPEFKAMRADAAAGGAAVRPGTLVFSAGVEADYRLK